MSLQVLLIEDSQHKRSRIVELLEESFPGIEITQANSYSSGCRAVENLAFDFVLVDMSLPTFDKSITESGGNFRPFGGREIARKLIRRKGHSNIIFITQYESFSDKGRSYSFASLKEELRNECGDSFRGMIFFDSSKSAWKNELLGAIQMVIDENTDC
ncbi:MAG: response regulator [Neobacillus sp.]